MRILISLFFLVSTFISFSQTKFVPGYFVNNSGDTISCLIKNEDWAHNPIKFNYKLNSDTPIATQTLETTKSFVINGASKFVRFTGDIDRSWALTTESDRNRNPEFTTETFFLKVVIEGDASLFSFDESNMRRFYYSKLGCEVKPLIYKPYYFLLPGDDREKGLVLAYNNKFRQQVWSDFRCGDLTMQDAENLDYSVQSLSSYFESYNICSGQPYINYQKNGNNSRTTYNLKIRPGLNFNKFTWFFGRSVMEFESKTNFRIGFENEVVLGFNNNKWAITVEPGYHYLNADDFFNTTKRGSTKYQAIEMPIGLRYYMFLSDKDKLFINLGVGFAYNLKSENIRYLGSVNQPISPAGSESNNQINSNLFIGAGYSRNNFISIEVRQNLTRNTLNKQYTENTELNILSIILGIRVL